MNMQLLKTFIVASIIAFAGCDKADKTAPQEKAAMPAETSTAPAPMAEEATAAAQEKPSMSETSVSTMEATVTAIDQATRAVTLQDAEGNSVSFVADDDVKNLAQVEVGDILTVDLDRVITSSRVARRGSRWPRKTLDHFRCQQHLLPRGLAKH